MSSPIADQDYDCFFCRRADRTIKQGERYVEWHEAVNYQENPTLEGVYRLRLHPRCAVMLGERLIGDACEANHHEPHPDFQSDRTILTLVESRTRQGQPYEDEDDD